MFDQICGVLLPSAGGNVELSTQGSLVLLLFWKLFSYFMTI